MADRVIFMGWKAPIVGREQQAMQLFRKTLEYCNLLQADERIESFDAVLLSAHGGDLNGFFLLKSDAKKLAEIREDDDFIGIAIEAGYCLDGFGTSMGYIGEGLSDVFSRWSIIIGE